jgi:ubiquinone/menaquinone biosynthesis C-methylase UbiE
MISPIQRFSSRVENYLKYRPSYPSAIIDLLATEAQLTPASIIADVGSGTGFLAKLLLENGNRVLGIEPNQEMRRAGERLLKDYPNFTSVTATAEATTLDDGSVDFVTAGQAFHWFKPEQAREEFARILKPPGWIVLVWNDRQTNTTPFLEAYERLLQTYATDYEAINHKHFNPMVMSIEMKVKQFENSQVFDFEGLKGRLLSSSYAPEVGQPNHETMLDELSRIFQAYQVNGKITFEYTTEVYYGQLKVK